MTTKKSANKRKSSEPVIRNAQTATAAKRSATKSGIQGSSTNPAERSPILPIYALNSRPILAQRGELSVAQRFVLFGEGKLPPAPKPEEDTELREAWRVSAARRGMMTEEQRMAEDEMEEFQKWKRDKAQRKMAKAARKVPSTSAKTTGKHGSVAKKRRRS